ncbi:MAG: phosphate ABC transporter permease subunit PstC [Rickettsiaceae bacterium H1]|nr:phosphate ABC transporter permease subunit PstC [Rickettsiaceae bacterium H1]
MIPKLFFYNFSIVAIALLFLITDRFLFVIGFSSIIVVFILTFPHFTLKLSMKVATFLSLVITVLIVLSLFHESRKFFQMISWTNFLFGTEWKPYNTINESGEIVMMFGIIPLLFGTFFVMIIAISFATPIGLFSAIYLSKYATNKERDIIKPVIELLAGIPTVIYGYFAMNIVSPFFYKLATYIGLEASFENAISAGIVIGIMIIPLITSLVDDIIQAVPKSLYYGALALGSTRAEALFKVVLPSSMPGIFSAVLLAVTRAIGETMVVLMATGVRANLTLNPLNSITTVTVQIATILKGDNDFSSPVTLSAYALGFVLFIVTWVLNAIAFTIVKRYRTGY